MRGFLGAREYHTLTFVWDDGKGNPNGNFEKTGLCLAS